MKKILVGAITIGVILGSGSSFAAADELDSISKMKIQFNQYLLQPQNQ